MQAGLGDRDPSIGQHERVPWRAQAGGEHAPFAGGQEHCHQVPGDGVAHQQPPRVEANALRLVEASERVKHGPIGVANQDPIVAGIRNRDPVPAVRGNLAGEYQVVLTPHQDGGERRPGGEVAPAIQELRDDTLERRAVPLAGGHRHHVAVGVDHDQRRPGTDAVLLPRLQVRVVQDGVRDAMPGHGSRDRGMIGLVRELRRVHADHHQAFPKALLERVAAPR